MKGNNNDNNISILIPVHNKIDYTKNSVRNIIDCIKNSNYKLNHDIFIIIFDDGSLDGSSEWINQNYPEIHVLQGDGNQWWTKSINQLAKYAIKKLNSKYLLLWNNDITADNSYFISLYDILNISDENSIYGSSIFDKQTHSQCLSSGGYFNKYTGNLKMKTNNVNSNKIDWITGMGTIIPTKLVVNNGYWDDEKFPHYFADADFTMRAKRNGASLVICNDFKIYNDTSNSGFFHDGKVRRLLKSFFVINSYYNIITRFRINRRYGVLILSDLCVIAYYLKIVFSFIKFILKRTTFFINIKRTFSTS